ncbi:MAG: DUF697 domain-containing protein [Candidatus Competibacteraceae bacterium]|nr:DUF697 domain-containing protein [Candidatus Competibacteraceae bacterium]MCB1808535.1 DUF697 domain-containing protein [Candidatus Competibacteraceae bacterium]MCB1813815.1 DUF697 domain-containing protein [Candidatus Competibacteraceae bacterium]
MPQTDKKIEPLQPESDTDAASVIASDSGASQPPSVDDQDALRTDEELMDDALLDEENERLGQAQAIVKNHVIGSMGISLVPIPLVDLVALSGIQIKMLHALARLYRVPFSENLGKSLIVSLVGGIMPTSTAMTLASLAKAIPGLGTATGMISVSVLGGATTYAIGNVFMQHFESGGTLLDFDPKTMRDYFASKLREGKQVATNLRQKPETSDKQNP